MLLPGLGLALVVAVPAKVLILPVEVTGSADAPDIRRQAFQTVFEQRLALRLRQRVVVALPSAVAARALSTEACREDCAAAAARALGADAWTEARIERRAGALGCRILTTLRGAPEGAVLREARATLERCGPDALELQAEILADRLGVGPRRAPPVDAPLSSSPVPDLRIHDLPDVKLRAVRTATTPRRFPLDRALRVYRARAIAVVEDDRGRTLFVQDGRPLGECGLRQVVDAPLPPAVREHCEGNDWIWALLGVPAGGVLAAVSFPDLEGGNLHGFVGVSTGLVVASASAILGLAASRRGHAPDSGAYLTDDDALARLARAGNARLREELELSEAEIRAGLARRPAGSGAR